MRKSRSGVLGVFGHLDATTDAIRRLRSAGFDQLTVYSPTLRHESPSSRQRRATAREGAIGASSCMASW